MDHTQIPRYDFNKEKAPIDFELVPIEFILNSSKDSGNIPHRLNFFQILCFLEGEGRHELDFESISYCKGTIIPVSKGQVQRFQDNAKTKGYSILFTTDFLVKEELDYHFLYDYMVFNHSIGSVSLEMNEQMQFLIEEMKREQDSNKKFARNEYLRNLLRLFLIQLERQKRSNIEIVCTESYALYLNFRKYVEEHISYKLKLAEICEQLNTSTKQLNNAVKLYTNNTAKQYVEDRLILEIKRLLVYSSLSVKEIAYETGFEDPTNFTKYFKARVKVLPTDYQKEYVDVRRK